MKSWWRIPLPKKSRVLTPKGGPHRRPISELGEIANEETTVVCGLGAYANAIQERSNSTNSIDRAGGSGSRSALTTRRNVPLVIHPQDSTAISIHVGKILGVLPSLVSHISVGRVRTGEEIPFATANSVQWKKNVGTGSCVLKERVAFVSVLEPIHVRCRLVFTSKFFYFVVDAVDSKSK